MKNLNIDGIRATVALAVTQGLNLLVLLGAVTLDVDQLAAVNAFVGTVLTLAMFFVKPSPPAPPPVVEIPLEELT